MFKPPVAYYPANSVMERACAVVKFKGFSWVSLCYFNNRNLKSCPSFSYRMLNMLKIIESFYNFLNR